METQEPQHEPITEEDGEVKINLAPSIRDALVAKREHNAAHRTTDIDIPGYDGKLFCRYNLLDSKRLNSIGDRVMKTMRENDERALAGALDTLIAACQEFYVRYEGKEHPLRDVVGQEEPVRYDSALADFLKFRDELPETPTARSVVLALFLSNEIAIASHNHQLSRWMMGNEAEVDEEFLGDPL